MLKCKSPLTALIRSQFSPRTSISIQVKRLIFMRCIKMWFKILGKIFIVPVSDYKKQGNWACDGFWNKQLVNITPYKALALSMFWAVYYTKDRICIEIFFLTQNKKKIHTLRAENWQLTHLEISRTNIFTPPQLIPWNE